MQSREHARPNRYSDLHPGARCPACDRSLDDQKASPWARAFDGPIWMIFWMMTSAFGLIVATIMMLLGYGD